MSCAWRCPCPTTARRPGYAIAWQDTRAAGCPSTTTAATATVQSYPFASATDFGGPDLQPPLAGLGRLRDATTASFVERTRSVELWRLDGGGQPAGRAR